MARSIPDDVAGAADADWRRRVVDRSLRTAAARSVDRGLSLIRAAAAVLERTDGADITVQDVADEAGQSLRTLYQYFESKDDLLLAVFEEAMRTYAALVSRAIGDLDDPLERLAGAVVAAARTEELSGTGLDRGLARLRFRLAEAEPDSVGRAQASMTGLMRELVEAAAADGSIECPDPEAATYMLLSLNAAFITSRTLGNDAGVDRPDVRGLASFGLQGLRARLPDGWFDRVNARLVFPDAPRGAKAPAAPRRRPAAKG